MALPQGINFRKTSSYVTDGVNEYAQIAGSLNYPTTTPQGNNVGWESIDGGVISIRNQSTSVDRRLAGLHFTNYPGAYRIDLPSAGSYNIRAAFGDATGAVRAEAYLKDNNTQVATLATRKALSADQFIDATDVTRVSSAAWVSSNAPLLQAFSSSIMRVLIGGGPTSNDYAIAHLYVESVSLTVAIGLSQESSSAQGVVRIKTKQVAQSAESDIANDALIVRGILIGQSFESDLSMAVDWNRSKSIGIPSELDEPVSFGKIKTYPLGLSVEFGESHPFGAQKSFSLGLAESYDVAFALESSRSVYVSGADEIDSSISINPVKHQYYVIATSEESDAAIAMIIGAAVRVKWGSAIRIDLFKEPIRLDMFSNPITIQ
jgi:hypothetical protein